MIVFREWELEWDKAAERPILRSPVRWTPWRSAVMTADAVPDAANQHGIYAFADWARRPTHYCGGLSVAAVGAMDVHGRIILHDDGVVRAERARILALRVLPSPCGCDGAAAVEFTLSSRETLSELAYCFCRYPQLQADARSLYRFETIDALERVLLNAYGVPRLPEGTGPLR